MKNELEQKLRSLLITLWANAANWICDHVVYADLDHPVGWRDHLRWWLEDLINPVFTFAYFGSNEEIFDVFHGYIPYEHLSERQLAVFHEMYAKRQPDFTLLALPCHVSVEIWEVA